MNKEDALVQCPYYRKDVPQGVNCEGVVDGSSVKLGFTAHNRLIDYKDAFCRQCWQNCLIAQMLNRKYDYSPEV